MIRFDETFDLPVSPDEAWVVLNDVPRIAHCMPGTKDVETVGDAEWRTTVGVKVGPLGMEFDATIHSSPLPESSRAAEIVVDATETSGKGVARTVILSTISEKGPAESSVSVSTHISFEGVMARHLKGPLVSTVGRQLTRRFAHNLRKELATPQLQEASAP